MNPCFICAWCLNLEALCAQYCAFFIGMQNAKYMPIFTVRFLVLECNTYVNPTNLWGGTHKFVVVIVSCRATSCERHGNLTTYNHFLLIIPLCL